MKVLWAALFGIIGLAATTGSVWSFEGDWSTWDKPQGTEAAGSGEDLSYGTPDAVTEEFGIYRLRALGRSESRWMGSLDGQIPSHGYQGMSRFDWSRGLGRAEAYHIDGSIRTAAYQDSHEAPGEALTGGAYGCNLVEANRAKGRDEARAVKVQPGEGAEQPNSLEMDEESEREAAARAAKREGC